MSKESLIKQKHRHSLIIIKYDCDSYLKYYNKIEMNLKRGYYDVFVNTCAKYASNIAVTQYDDGLYKSYTYSELYGVCEYISQNLQQLKCNKGVIGLVSERNIVIPCMIAAAHKCCTTFMFVDPTQDIESIAKELQFTIVIVIKNIDDIDQGSNLFGKKPNKIVSVFNVTINFYKCDLPNDPSNKNLPQHSFIAMTSGSTGQPKHIQVPIQCIQPNIDDLTKLFNIQSHDVIYFSTPLTFDPSMVEILLACMNGASLLIAPAKADILFPKNRQNSITFWQTTPSKFLQFTNSDIRNRILCANSTLRILALGGEPLNNVKRLKELRHGENRTKIFTLYGVTEMSCWASVSELDLNTAIDREIPLGTCLSETQVIVDKVKKNENTGKIVLVSKTRRCIILNKTKGNDEENCLKFVDTGDIGEIKNGTIYYRGRRDDTIKRFGHKVHLQFIEATVMQCPKVKTCACLWLPKPQLLVVYYSSESINSQELSDFLKCKLDDKHWPDKIIRVSNIPTNNHGKISKQDLCKAYEKTTGISHSVDSLKLLFLNELKLVLGKFFTFDQIKDKDFYSIGGTSFLALSMCNKLSLTFPFFGKLILPYLLTQQNTIDDIMQIAQKEIFGTNSNQKKAAKRYRQINDVSKPQSDMDTQSYKKPNMQSLINNFVEFVTLWSFDTGKCVDASPTLFQGGFNLYVTVGSHSGKIVVLDARSGELQGMVTLKTRIEAGVLCWPDVPSGPTYGVVGGYDGTIVCFSLESTQVLWIINIGAMIKSKAVCCGGQLYIASYDGNVRCINIMSGAIISVIDICELGISADLVLAKNEYVLLGSLSGLCANIHTGTNTVKWRGTLNSPVFASPVLYDDDKYVVFAEVRGYIHCRTVEKGIKIWRFLGAQGSIFSSLYIKQLDNMKWQMIFGCHDNKVYSIHLKKYLPSLHWKTKLTSPVYSTPCSLINGWILAASNNGKLCIMNPDSGRLLHEYQLPNETFSSPSIYGEYIFIGCRNNHLYSIKYTVNI